MSISEILRKLRDHRAYEQRKKMKSIYCETCCSYVDKYAYEKHLQTKKHARLEEYAKKKQQT